MDNHEATFYSLQLRLVGVIRAILPAQSRIDCLA